MRPMYIKETEDVEGLICTKFLSRQSILSDSSGNLSLNNQQTSRLLDIDNEIPWSKS